jgi:hypothetical protein
MSWTRTLSFDYISLCTNKLKRKVAIIYIYYTTSKKKKTGLGELCVCYY